MAGWLRLQWRLVMTGSNRRRPRAPAMCKWLVMALCVVLLAGCNSGHGGQAMSPSAPPVTTTPAGSGPQAQAVTTVTTRNTPVTAGLVVAPPQAGIDFTLVKQPQHGSVTRDGARFTYTPESGFTGSDTFRYAVAASDDATTPASVHVRVLDNTPPGPPGLAAVCHALGSAFSPLCDTLDSATQTLVGGCATMAPQAFCDIFGGDLETLAQGCYGALTGQPQVLCKALDDVFQGAASLCRSLGVPTDFCALLSGDVIAQRAIANYRAGPVHRALAAQRPLSDSLPLRNTLLPATHNSFNFTNASFPPSVSGLDPDQLYSMTQQLSLDMRGLELDVHWFPSIASGAFEPLLCHAQTNHIGCTIERTLADGLQAIRGWLDAHPQAVIVLDIEQHLNDSVDDTSKSFPAAAKMIEDTLGKNSKRDLILRPGQPGKAASCENHAIPLSLSIDQIRAAGKQVLIYSSGCGNNDAWDAIIHSEANRLQGPSTDFGNTHYPDCVFTRKQHHDSWTRFYDSSTLIDAVSGSGTARPVTPEQIRQMVRCGVNMPSINFLNPHTTQLQSFIWSWADGQPVDVPAQHCAVENAQGRFQAESCEQFLSYTCRDDAGWHVTATRGVFADAPEACAAEFPGSHFAVPRNGYRNEQLKAAKSNAGASRIWVNYDNRSEHWQSVADGNTVD